MRKLKQIVAQPILKQTMTDKGLTSVAVAEGTGLTTMTMVNLLKGKNVREETAELLIDYFDIPREELFSISYKISK